MSSGWVATLEFCQMVPAHAPANRHHVRVPILTVETAEGVRIRTEIAGVGSRLAAAVADLTLIVAGYLVLLLVLLLGKMLISQVGLDVLNGISEFAVGLATGGFVLLLPLYFILFHKLWNGQTPGKRLIGIRVVSVHGDAGTIMQYLLRGVLWPVDALLFMPVPIGLMLIVITERCQRLGDMAAGTLVLNERKPAGTEEPWHDETWSARENKTLDLSPGMATKLDEQDVLLLRDAICRRDIPAGQRTKIYREIVKFYGELLGFTPSPNERINMKELYLLGRESRR